MYPYRSIALCQQRPGKLRIAAMFLATVLAVVSGYWGSIRLYTMMNEQTSLQAMGALLVGAVCWVLSGWFGRLKKVDIPSLRLCRMIVAALTAVIVVWLFPFGPVARRMMCVDAGPESGWCQPLKEGGD